MTTDLATAVDEPAQADVPTTVDDLPDELLERIVMALAEDYCSGVVSLVRLARCSRQLHALVANPSVLALCAAQYELSSAPAVTFASHVSFELLSVIETVAGLGTNRVLFTRGKASAVNQLGTDQPVIRPGSSMPRVVEFALLLRRHPKLSVRIEGHEGTHEAVHHAAGDGHVRMSLGASVQRAEAVRSALLDLECLERLDRRGNRVWGRMARPGFKSRITCRGWEDAVAAEAGWTTPLETSHAEVFFSLGGVEVPSRGVAYAAAAAQMESHHS